MIWYNFFVKFQKFGWVVSKFAAQNERIDNSDWEISTFFWECIENYSLFLMGNQYNLEKHAVH